MKTVFQTLLLVVAIIALAVVIDQITPLKQLTLYLDQHPEPYRRITIGMSVLGWVLMGYVFFLVLWMRGRPMSEDEARQFMRTSAGRPMINRAFRGKAVGREARTGASFHDIKEAFISGDWSRDPGWWPIFIGLLALPLVAYGMFGYFIVIGPPTVKVICAAALAYATVRTVWGFWKA
jgi:hypothetical protein